MTKPKEQPYRHERLEAGSLEEPGTVQLFLDIGDRSDLHEILRERLVQIGAAPEMWIAVEQWVSPAFAYQDFTGYSPRVMRPGSIAHMARFRATLIEEMAEKARKALRGADDFDAEPFTAHLKHVIAQYEASGKVRSVEPEDVSEWMHPRVGYVAMHPNVLEVHHIVRFSDERMEPPIQLAELAARLKSLNIAAWERCWEADGWCFRSTTPIQSNGDMLSFVNRSHSKVAAALKEVARDAQVSTVVEQVMACWTYPLELREDNRHRMTLRHVTGASDQRLPNLRLILEQCLKSGPKFNVSNEDARSRVLSNIEPFRRVAVAQGVRPLVLALGIIPATITAEGPRFADYFCTQAAAYGSSEDEANQLLEAYRRMIWFLVNSGFNPVLSPPKDNEKVEFWAELLPESKPGRKSGRSTNTNKSLDSFGSVAGEQTISMALHQQFKRIEDAVLELIATNMGRSKSFEFHDTGIMAVCFRTDATGSGEELYGCLCGLVTAPGLNLARLHQVAFYEGVMLSRAPYQSPTAPPNVAQIPEPLSKSETRKKQAREHDKLWDSFEILLLEPAGTRMRVMISRFSEAYALFKMYPKLAGMEAEIESDSNLTPLIEAAWFAMTGTKRTSLFNWRAEAGLPYRRLR